MTFPILPTDELNYHISRGNVEFGINDLNDADCMAVLTSSDARIRLNVDFEPIYRKVFYDGLPEDDITPDIMPRLFDDDGNYRTWQLVGFPTHFPTSDKRYCHVAIKYDSGLNKPNEEDHIIEKKAVIVFSRFRLDFYGRPISDDGESFLKKSSNPSDPEGMEPVTVLPDDYEERDLFPADECHFFLYVGRISSSLYVEDNVSSSIDRQWEDGPNLGIVGTPQYLERLRASEQAAAVRLELDVVPEIAHFSWMGTDYAQDSVNVHASIVNPNQPNTNTGGGTGGEGGEGGNTPQQRGLSNVVEEMSLVVREPNLIISPAQPDQETQSVFVDEKGRVLRNTEMIFGVRQYIANQLTTEFSSMNITSSLPAGVRVEISPISGQIRLTLPEGTYIGTGFSFDVDVSGATNTVHFKVSALNASQLNVSSLKGYRLDPTYWSFIRKDENGIITPDKVKYIFVQVSLEGSSTVIQSGCHLWYRRDDETTWIKADDIDISSAEGDGRYLASVPTAGTQHKLHVRWTVNDDPADIVERYILGNEPEPEEPSDPEQPDEPSDEPETPSLVDVGDYFIVGSFDRMPADGEPGVFSQITNGAPSDDENGSDAENGGEGAQDDSNAEVQPMLAAEIADPEGSPAPGAPGTDGSDITGPADPGASDEPLDKDDTDKDEPQFIIATDFTVTVDRQQLYLALYEKASKKVIDSRVVPVVKDGKSVGNVRPNLLSNSCFMFLREDGYQISEGAYFLREQDFGGYPILCFDPNATPTVDEEHPEPSHDDDQPEQEDEAAPVSEDTPEDIIQAAPLHSLTFPLSTPLDGAVWQPASTYVLSIWARGAGKFSMSALGAAFVAADPTVFTLTDTWQRYSITIKTADTISDPDGSTLILASYPIVADEEADNPEDAPADADPSLASAFSTVLGRELPSDPSADPESTEADSEEEEESPTPGIFDDDDTPSTDIHDPIIVGDFMHIACPKLEHGDTLTEWCLSETDKRGIGTTGEDALTVHLSKTLIPVSKIASVWAEDGVDGEDTIKAIQTVVIEAKVFIGYKDLDIIRSARMSELEGITNVEYARTEDKQHVIITFDVTESLDLSDNHDLTLTFVTQHSSADGVSAVITLVPTADGTPGAPGENAFPLLARFAPTKDTPFDGWHVDFVDGQDLWMIQSTDNGETWSRPIRVVGEQGEKGDGADWIDYSFAISADVSTAAASIAPSTPFGWHDEPQKVTEECPYLWMRTTKKIFDSEVEGSYRDGATRYIRINGEDGADGTKIDHVTKEYAISADGVNPPTEGWSENRPEPIQGWYIWTKITTYYQDDTEPLVEYYIEYIPNDSEAQSLLVFDLDNEMETVVCDADGKLENAFSVTIPGHLYYGIQEIDTDKYTIEVSRDAMGDFSVFVDQDNKTVTISGAEGAELDSDTSNLTVTATFDGETRTSVFSLSRIRNGIKGEHAVVYRLLPSISQIPFQRDSDGNLTPASIDVTTDIQVVTGGSASLIHLNELPDGVAVRYSFITTPLTPTAGDAMTQAVSVDNNKSCLYIALFVDGVLMDRESIPVVKDGRVGERVTVYRLVVSPSSILKLEGGTLSYNYVTCSLVRELANGVVEPMLELPQGYSIRAGIDAASAEFSSVPFTIDNIPYEASQVVFELYNGDTLVNMTIVYLSKEGGKGEDGLTLSSMINRYAVTVTDDAPACENLEQFNDTDVWRSRESALAEWSETNRYMWQATKVEYKRNDEFERNDFFVSPAGVWGQTGRDRINFDLDNEFDAIQYDADDNKISGDISTVGTVYDGGTAITNPDELDFNILAFSGMSASDLTLVKQDNGTVVLTVSGMTATSGYVVIRASYKGNSYDARFSCLKLVGTDKYELICTPNSIAYNETTHVASSNTINVKVFKTDAEGDRYQLEEIESGYMLIVDGVAATSYGVDGFSFPVNTSAAHHIISFVRGTIDDHQVLDTETIPISKTENGTNGISYELIASPSSIIKHEDGSLSQTEVVCNLVRKNADGTADVLDAFPAHYAAKAGVDAANTDKTTLPITVSGITDAATQVVFELYCNSNMIQSLYVPIIAEGGEGQEGIGIVSEMSRFKATATDTAPTCVNDTEFGTWSDITTAMESWSEETPYMWRVTRTQYNRALPESGQSVVFIVSPAGVFGQSGADNIRLDLDNEFDAIQYNADGVKVGGSVSSQATLYEGGAPVTSGVTFSKGSYSGMGADDATVTASGVVTVSNLTNAAGFVTVNATYNGNTYYAKFSVQKLVGSDKYELFCTPNSLVYNRTTDAGRTAAITVNVYKTSVAGERSLLQSLPDGYLLIVNGESLSYSSGQCVMTVNFSNDDYDISIVKGTVSEHIVLDHETIPIAKVGDGATPEIGDNGNWFIGGEDTLIPAEGSSGDDAVMYQIDARPDKINFRRNADNTLAQETITLKAGLNKATGMMLAEVTPDKYTMRYSYTETPETSSAGSEFASDGLTLTGSTCETNAYNAVYLSAFDNEGVRLASLTVPISIDPRNGTSGEDSIVLSLDNEFDTLLYTDEGTTTDKVTTRARLYKGYNPVPFSSVTFSIHERSGVPEECVSTPEDTALKGTYEVNGMTANTGYVVIKATYQGQDYFAKFSLAKLVGTAKYSLNCTPTNISYNSTSQNSSSNEIRISVTKVTSMGMKMVLHSLPTGVTLKADGVASSYTWDGTKTCGVLISPIDFTNKDKYEISLVQTVNEEEVILDVQTVTINKAADGKIFKPLLGEDGKLHFELVDPTNTGGAEPDPIPLYPAVDSTTDADGNTHVTIGKEEFVIYNSDSKNLLDGTMNGKENWGCYKSSDATGELVDGTDVVSEVIFRKKVVRTQLFPYRILPSQFKAKLVGNKNYTVSFLYKTTLDADVFTKIAVKICTQTASGSFGGDSVNLTADDRYLINVVKNGEWNKASVTFKTKEKIPAGNFVMFIYLANSTGGDVFFNYTGSLHFAQLQIEAGDYASEWTTTASDNHGILVKVTEAKQMAEGATEVVRDLHDLIGNEDGGLVKEINDTKTDVEAVAAAAAEAQSKANEAKGTASAAVANAAAARTAADEAKAILEIETFRDKLQTVTGVKFPGSGVIRFDGAKSGTGMFLTSGGVSIVGDKGADGKTQIVELNSTNICGASSNCTETPKNPFDSADSGSTSGPGSEQMSDMRLKDVLSNIELSLDAIANAPIFDFRYKHSDQEHSGTSAQYWQTILPNVVHEDNNGYLSLQYAQAALVAVVSLARKVKELEAEIARLRN